MLLTDDAERVMSKLKQNFGNTTSIMNQLEESINQFPDVHDSSQYLRFWNIVENILRQQLILELLNKSRILTNNNVKKYHQEYKCTGSKEMKSFRHASSVATVRMI
jgi:hypothetical protein